MVAAAVVLTLLAQQYPLEAPPRQPVIAVPMMGLLVPAPRLDIQPDASQPMRILFVFPPAVATTQATADAKCASRMSSLNSIYGNDPAMLGRFEQAGCKLATHYTPQGGVSQDLTWVTGDPTVASWRTQLGADLVSFDSQYGDWCGMAWECAANFGPTYAFTSVSEQCAISNMSLAHEVGHNLCIDHDIPNDGGAQFPYGHGFCPGAIDTSRRDPMVYPSPCGGNRVPYFGNPNISPFGYPFGDAATADPARVIREQWAKIAALLPPPSSTHRPSSVTSLAAIQ